MEKDKIVTCNIGAWGPKSAGKTIYISMCYHLITSLPSLTELCWDMKIDDPETEKQLKLLSRQIKNNNPVLPPSTDDRKLYYCVLEGYASSFRLGRLTENVRLTDWAGEWLTRNQQDSTFYHELSNCDAIMCFIDPELDPKHVDPGDPDTGQLKYDDRRTFYHEELKTLVNKLRAGGRRKVPQTMAFVITKIDVNVEYWKRRQNPEELLRYVLGDATYQMIRKACKVRKFFACSSIGAVLTETGKYVGSNLVVKTVGEEKQFEIRDLANLERLQFGVVDPFIWVLERTKWRRMWGTLPPRKSLEMGVHPN